MLPRKLQRNGIVLDSSVKRIAALGESSLELPRRMLLSDHYASGKPVTTSYGKPFDHFVNS